MATTNIYTRELTYSEVSTTQKHPRVAWLFPSLARTHYWQPVFREFTRAIPETRVFTGCWGGFAPGYEGTFNIRLIEGVRPVAVKNNKEGYKPGFLWAPLSITRDLAEFQPDIIFTSGFTSWTICALLYKLVRGSAVVVLWDGCSAHSAWKISSVRHLLRRLIAPFIDFGVSNMREGVEYLRDVLSIPERKLLSHPYQVADPAILDSTAPTAQESLRHKRPAFLFVGTINQRKGWRYLLEAAHLLLKRGIDEFSVIFVGAGAQEEELRKTIVEQGLSHIASHIGPIPYQRMATCYRETDVFVFPTTEDVWGVVLAEAMVFGKAVICSKYAGARELVEHEVNGFICDPRNVEALAEYMSRFIHDRSLIPVFGARSRERIAPFTSSRAAEVLANIALRAQRESKKIAVSKKAGRKG
jgi:glycosyltransferase involved in cell wall biosynthesis